MCHAGAPDAQHARQKLLRQLKFAAQHPVLREQQPAHKARADEVEQIACRGLRCLHQQSVKVVIDLLLQRGIPFDFSEKRRAVHP